MYKQRCGGILRAAFERHHASFATDEVLRDVEEGAKCFPRWRWGNLGFIWGGCRLEDLHRVITPRRELLQVSVVVDGGPAGGQYRILQPVLTSDGGRRDVQVCIRRGGRGGEVGSWRAEDGGGVGRASGEEIGRAWPST